LIPTLIGQEVSDAERQILALPLRHGELGLTNPKETPETEYDCYTLIIAKLTEKTYNQRLDLEKPPLRPEIHQTHEKQNTTREERKMPT